MTSVTTISIEQISRRSEARSFNEGAVESLAESISEVGLINPIRVRRRNDGSYEVTAGSHRLAACDSLAYREIACIVVDDDDLHAELASIDENLCRAELSPSDRARQTARRKEIYEELHPETKAGAAQVAGMQRSLGNVADKLSATSFTKATAEATGKNERSVRRDAERGDKILPEAHDRIRGTRLDTGIYLNKLKKVPEGEQLVVVEHDLGVKPKPCSNRKAKTAETTPAAAHAGDAFTLFIELADRLDTLSVNDILKNTGARRAVLGQRASCIADMMNVIMEGVGHA